VLKIGELKITPQILSAIAEIDEFKGKWENIQNFSPEKLLALKKISTIESIGSSNRIEENKLTDKEIEKLLSCIKTKSFDSRDEEEVGGYAELLDAIFENYEIIPLSENYIKQLHKILLQYTQKDEKHRGEYKKMSNSIVAFDSDGKEIGVIFETTSPFDTPKQMDDLLEWTKKNLDDNFYHPLIVIGIFVVVFLAIHPFQDGNGRLSRAITTLLLQQKGYAYIPYSSVESIVERNKEGYYRALRKTQSTISTLTPNFEPWISFFLATLLKQKRHLEVKISKIKQTKNLGKEERKPAVSLTKQKILSLFERQNCLTSSEIADSLNLNLETAKKAVKTLLLKNYIIKNGSTKGAWYSKAET